MSNWQGIETVTPPTGSLLPIGVVRSWVKANEDGSDDADLLLLVQSAVTAAEQYARIRLFTQTIRMRGRCLRDGMRLPIGPVQSISKIEYLPAAGGAAVELDASIYEASLFGLMRPQVHLVSGQAWPALFSSPAAVIVTAVAGFGGINDLPPDIRLALKMTVAAWFEDRTAGVTPQEAMDKLDHYRIPRIS